jgi:hypothetical protein
MVDERKEIYNKYEEFPDLTYNCIDYLLKNNDTIWKLLKYTDNNAYKNDAAHPNLTTAQKGYLINDGTPDPEYDRFRVFLDVGQDNTITKEMCILRIEPVKLVPKNHIYGSVAMAFEVYAHAKINTMSNYKSRIDVITQQLIATFNGQEIGGLGRLAFDARMSSLCSTTITGQIPMKGKCTVLTNWIA